MPIFFQHPVNDNTRLGIWKIEETEDFFKGNVPAHRDVTHPHKRLQHLAGRFLLQFLFPGFPYELVRIADTNKPFLEDEQYHFSISHCGDYAAAIVSTTHRVGIDIEIPKPQILRISEKFLSLEEFSIFQIPSFASLSMTNPASRIPDPQLLTLLWSAKETVFKWHGNGAVDFRKDIQLQSLQEDKETIACFFAKTDQSLTIRYHRFEQLTLAWVLSDNRQLAMDNGQ